MRQALKQRENLSGLAIVERQSASCRLLSDEAEGGAEGLLGKVGYDPKPGEKRRRSSIETSVTKLFCQGLPFKIHGGVAEAVRNSDEVALQQLALPLLRSRVIYFKDA